MNCDLNLTTTQKLAMAHRDLNMKAKIKKLTEDNITYTKSLGDHEIMAGDRRSVSKDE